MCRSNWYIHPKGTRWYSNWLYVTHYDRPSHWFEIVELLVTEDTVIPMDTKGHKGMKTHTTTKQACNDKHLVKQDLVQLVSTLSTDYLWQWKWIWTHFKALCDTSCIKCKLTIVKNLTANTILEQVHQVIMTMLHTAELDITTTVAPSDIDTFVTDVAWAIHSTTIQYLHPHLV